MGKLENDCIVLLKYLSDNPDCDQSYKSLSEATLIDEKRIFDIIYFPWFGRDSVAENSWALKKYAGKYGYSINVVFGAKGLHILVVDWGH